MNTRIRWRLLLVALALAANAQAQSGPALGPVKVGGGLISGLALGEKKDVCAYKGIPYAAPPVGALRWRPPQPVKPWDGVRACVEYGPSCPQPKPLMGGAPVKADEDCLYLNVWAPLRA